MSGVLDGSQGETTQVTESHHHSSRSSDNLALIVFVIGLLVLIFRLLLDLCPPLLRQNKIRVYLDKQLQTGDIGPTNERDKKFEMAGTGIGQHLDRSCI